MMTADNSNHLLTPESLLKAVHVELVQVSNTIDHKDNHLILYVILEIEIHI